MAKQCQKVTTATPTQGVAEATVSKAVDPLTAFNRKLQLIGDRVRGVALAFYAATYIVGRPGTGKTITAKDTLKELGVPWVHRNSRMTPMGLYSFLEEHPDHSIVLDDVSTLFKSDMAMQILLAALDGPPGEPRTIMYKSLDEDTRFEFSGGIIAISNVPLRSDPLARALGSRVISLEHEPSDDELTAFMRDQASKGCDGLTIDECQMVVEFVIAETRAFDLRLDLRHAVKAWQDLKQFKAGKALTPWQDLVRSSLRKPISEPAAPMSKKEELELDRQKVRDAIRKFPNDTAAQIKFSGLEKSTFYNRRKEVVRDIAS